MKHEQSINPPLLIHSDNDCDFMIATKMEIFVSYGYQQITYFGDVHTYEFGEVGLAYKNGEWVYDANLNGKMERE